MYVYNWRSSNWVASRSADRIEREVLTAGSEGWKALHNQLSRGR